MPNKEAKYLKHLENLRAIRKWLKGKSLPEAEKNIMRGLINVRMKELKDEKTTT